jgi:hypothetical protein
LLKALQNGYRGLFIRAQDLFDEMYASLIARSHASLSTRPQNSGIVIISNPGS